VAFRAALRARSQQQTFDAYVHAVDLVDARIEQLERAIREAAEQQSWRALVARLRCLAGSTP
jgi:DnaJ-domain-containing protein 1